VLISGSKEKGNVKWSVATRLPRYGLGLYSSNTDNPNDHDYDDALLYFSSTLWFRKCFHKIFEKLLSIKEGCKIYI
jgi:hypothetical protein